MSVSTPRTNRAYTAALIGDADSASINGVTAAIAESIGEFGKVISGDYLDRKNLSDKARLFHIGCYSQGSLVDLVSCPLSLRNAAFALNQSERLVWVVRPDELSDSLRRAISASCLFDARSHLLVLNGGGLSGELSADPELMELMEVEARDLFSSNGISIESVFRATIEGLAVTDGGAGRCQELAAYLFQNWLRPQASADATTVVSVEQSYSVSRPSGMSSRVAYGPVRGKNIAVGDSLALLGQSSDVLRVSELQEFGQIVNQALSGSSVAILFHAAPRERPKAGEILAEVPSAFVAAVEFSADVSVLRSESIAQILGSMAGVDVCVGFASQSCSIVDLVPSESESHKARIRLRGSSPFFCLPGQPILIGHNPRILAWGVLANDERLS